MINRIFRINRSDPRGGSTTGRLCLGTVGAGLLALCLCASASAEVFYTMVEPCDLAVVNTDTGMTDVIGSTWDDWENEYSVEALTFGPDGALYATVEDGCHLHGSAHQLATINPDTAEVSFIGDIGEWVVIDDETVCEGFCDVDAIAFSPDGTLYGVAVPGAQLITIDTDTGAGTAVGDGLGSFNFVGAIEFLRDGTLVGVDFGDGGGGPTYLFTIDPVSGEGTLVGPVDFRSVEGLSLARDSGLYGMADALEAGPGSLIEIDPTTAAGTFVQSVPASGSGFLDGLAACSDDSSELVYFSSGDRIMRLPTADCGTLSILYDAGSNETLEEFLGLNYGPDQWLYFCARGYEEEGLMGRIDPADPLGTFEILYDSSGSVDGPDEPECGWFTHEGDFMVSDVDNGEIWMFEDLAGNPAAGPVPIADVNNGAGQLTQYINGDLLVVVPNNAGVSSTDFPTFFPGQGPAVPDTLISGLGDANGIAVSFGFVFVSTGYDVNRYTIDYDPMGVDPPAGEFKDECANFGVGDGNPGHLASTINGKIYAGTTEGLLFRVDFDPEGGTTGSCDVSAPLFYVEDYPDYDYYCDDDIDCDYPPPITGVAVTETSLSVTREDITGTELFTFNNANTWEFTPDEPAGTCDATITATLTANAVVDEMIASIDAVPKPLTGDESVQCLGDNGFDIVWETDFDDCLLATTEDFYRHLVNCYLPMFNGDANLRIGVNEELPPDEATGELMDLTVSIPINPDLVPVDPIGGRRRRGSHNYWVRVPLPTNPGDRGTFCGFRPPLRTTLDPNKARKVKIGSTVPVKFRLAEFEGSCKKGPWRTDAQAVLSVAHLDPLQVVFPLHARGRGDEENSLFEPGRQYQFNLDTAGYLPGLHMLTVTFPDGEAPQAVTLIRLVD